MELGKLIFESAAQLVKALSIMVVSPSGNTISRTFMQFCIAPNAMVVVFSFTTNVPSVLGGT